MSKVYNPELYSTADVNLIAARKNLTNKLQEIAPVIDFYKELCLGWNQRLKLAESALSQLPATEIRDIIILKELKEVARKDTITSGETYKSISKVKKEMEEKIQDLDLLALKNVNRSKFSAADIGLADIQRLLYASDALLELRDAQVKGLTS